MRVFMLHYLPCSLNFLIFWYLDIYLIFICLSYACFYRRRGEKRMDRFLFLFIIIYIIHRSISCLPIHLDGARILWLIHISLLPSDQYIYFLTSSPTKTTLFNDYYLYRHSDYLLLTQASTLLSFIGVTFFPISSRTTTSSAWFKTNLAFQNVSQKIHLLPSILCYRFPSDK